MKLYYLLAVVVLWQKVPMPKPIELVVADDPFCHVEVVELTVDDPETQLALFVSGNDTIIQETQCWTDHGKLPPGHWTHFQAATWCPPDYSGMCDGRYSCVRDTK